MGVVGLVCATPDGSRAVFLSTDDIAALQQSVALVLDRPTVAGPELDLAAFRRLSRALEMGDVEAISAGSDPVKLSESEQNAFELMRHQADVRSGLPLRLLYVCAACGRERIVNPTRKTSSRTEPGRIVDAVASGAQWLEAGHPFIATLSFIESIGGGSNASSDAAVPPCERCDGDEFDIRSVTFCPGCREIRSETVLLICPECGHDFAARGREREFWTTREEAADAFRRAATQELLTERLRDVENGSHAGQRTALVGMLTHADELVGICRCRLPGQVGRYVIVVFTSEALVWARQSMVSSTTSGRVDWRDVARLSPVGTTGADRGFEIVTDSGGGLTLVDFRGTGISLKAVPATFDADGVHGLVSTLVRARNPSATISSPQPIVAPQRPPVPVPAAPPQAIPPGWYPDPWGQARLRWWDGVRWSVTTAP